MPFHPAWIHIPIAFALFSPFVAGFFYLRARAAHHSWAFFVLWQFIQSALIYVAMYTGQLDADSMKDAIDADAVNQHRLAAEQFYYVTLLNLAITLAGLGVGKARRYLRMGTVILSIISVFMCYRAGTAGGKLVYEFDAPVLLKKIKSQ